MAKRDIKQKHNKNIPGPSKRCQLNPKGWNHLAPLWRCWYDAIWANYEKNPRDSIYFSPPLAVTVPNQRFGHAVFFPEWCGPTSPLVATCKSLPIYSKQLTALKSHNSRFNKNKHLEMVKCCVSISFKPNNKLKKFTELKTGYTISSFYSYCSPRTVRIRNGSCRPRANCRLSTCGGHQVDMQI